MLTFIVIVLYALVILLDFIPHRKEGTIMNGILYCAMMTVSFAVLILYSFGIQIWKPSEMIEKIVNALVHPS